MKKERIENKINQLIELLDYLISKEDFNAYKVSKTNYYTVYGNLKSKKDSDVIYESDFDEIRSSFRIFLEAPPKDEILGVNILNTIQEIYELQTQILSRSS